MLNKIKAQKKSYFFNIKTSDKVMIIDTKGIATKKVYYT